MFGNNIFIPDQQKKSSIASHEGSGNENFYLQYLYLQKQFCCIAQNLLWLHTVSLPSVWQTVLLCHAHNASLTRDEG